MAREYAPLLKPRPFPSIPAGIELMILETCLAVPSVESEVDTQARHITALVSFDPLPSGRRQLRMFAASLIAAVPAFKQARGEGDISSWLVREINHYLPASACIVFSLPAYSPDVEQTIVAALSKTRDSCHHDIQLVIAVASNPADWAACRGIDGFVLAQEQRDAFALQIFSMVASLGAPEFLSPIDAEDLSNVMGDAFKPSQLIEAVWFSHTNQLYLSSPEHLAVLERAKAAAFMPAITLKLASLALMTQAIVGQVSASCSVISVATYGLVVAAVPGIVPIAIVCLV